MRATTRAMLVDALWEITAVRAGLVVGRELGLVRVAAGRAAELLRDALGGEQEGPGHPEQRLTAAQQAALDPQGGQGEGPASAGWHGVVARAGLPIPGAGSEEWDKLPAEVRALADAEDDSREV